MEEKTVLVIEDDPNIVDILKFNFQNNSLLIFVIIFF